MDQKSSEMGRDTAGGKSAEIRSASACHRHSRSKGLSVYFRVGHTYKLAVLHWTLNDEAAKVMPRFVQTFSSFPVHQPFWVVWGLQFRDKLSGVNFFSDLKVEGCWIRYRCFITQKVLRK